MFVMSFRDVMLAVAAVTLVVSVTSIMCHVHIIRLMYQTHSRIITEYYFLWRPALLTGRGLALLRSPWWPSSWWRCVRCPSCSSRLFFTRKNLDGMVKSFQLFCPGADVNRILIEATVKNSAVHHAILRRPLLRTVNVAPCFTNVAAVICANATSR